ncbi:hypothetical protein D3C80_1748900 [compost metagenome]
MKTKESRIPDLTTEIAQRVEANADALASIGVKEWMRQRRRKANMTELEQKEAVRKLEDEKLDDKRT